MKEQKHKHIRTILEIPDMKMDHAFTPGFGYLKRIFKLKITSQMIIQEKNGVKYKYTVYNSTKCF